MKILFTIAHFFNSKGGGRYGSLSPNPQSRINALDNSITAIKQLFNKQYIIDIIRHQAIPANQTENYETDIIICTTQNMHILNYLSSQPNEYSHNPTNAESMMLGFECQAVLKENLGKYDYYCFMEDDLIIHDPYFFIKLSWFTSQLGNSCLLQPNRYELSSQGPIYKAYVDGNINPRATINFQNINENPEVTGNIMGVPVVFRRPLNPHSGCYFLNSEQMDYWSKQPYFLDRDTSFIGPLESAATLGVMKTFKIYKPIPQNANFFEIQHYGKNFLSLLGKQIAVAE